jgi:hypothetical protein
VTNRPPEFNARFLAGSTARAALTGVWTATAELPAAKRRAVRAGLLGTAVLMTAAAGDRPRAGADGIVPPAPPQDPSRTTTEPTPAAPAVRAATAAAGIGLSIAFYAGGKRLENLWLARLARNGHAHPHRALGVRMAALSLLTSLCLRRLSTQVASRWPAPDPAGPES